MDAIEIALRCLEIGKGDEVITTPITAFATVLAIIRAGATPVLADIDYATGLMSIESAERCISPKTKGIVLVHLYGQMRNLQNWNRLCEAHQIHLIEDCAQAHHAFSCNKHAGLYGTISAFSFYPTKNLGALGDGGVIVTNDTHLAEKASMLRNYGQKARYHHHELGLNSRLDEMQAAILNVRLKWLKEFTDKRKAIAKAYFDGIRNPEVNLLAKPEEEAAHVYHLFVVSCNKRSQLQQHLKNNGIQTHIHYPVPVHQQKPCTTLDRDSNGLKVSEKFSVNCLSLPCHPQMVDMQVATIIEAVNSFRAN
jgi:dTDP-4-amino-4,6-dideoxygalactose transaminase